MNRLDEVQVAKAHGEMVAAATRLASGQINFIDGVRRVSGLRELVSTSGQDPDFMLFVAIESESDHIPGLEQRKYCTLKWLARCDQEALELESCWIGQVRTACEVLVKRFSA